MPIVEALGWIVITFGSNMALGPGHVLEGVNEAFARGVDSGDSCWDRVAGEEGSYGGPENYTLDLICNYRLKKETVTKDVTSWSLTRG